MANNRTRNSELEKQVRAQRRRVQNTISRLKRQGYTVEYNVPKLPKNVTESTLIKYQNITPQSIIKKSSYVTETGKVISGTKRREQIRKEGIRKATETRRKRYEESSKIDEDFVSKRKQIDSEEYERISNDKYAQELFNKGQIMYNQMMELIQTAFGDPKHEKVAQYVLEALEDSIAQYGFRETMMSIAQCPDIIEKLETVLAWYDPRQQGFDTAFNELLNLIRGEIPTAQEMQERQDLLESMYYETEV